ncbi:MAG: carbonic anhydrase [Campylobacterota bacterium]
MSLKNTVISIFVVFILALMLGEGEPEPLAQWSYEKEDGPKKWASLDDRYFMCGEGKNQSPINISNAVEANLATLTLNGNSNANTFVNTGNSLEVNFSNGNQLVVNDETYNLKKLSFHTPSEHTIDGKNFPLEAQLVHTNGSNLAIIAVMFEVGDDNIVLNKLFRNFPEQEGDRNELKSEVKGYELLPTNKDYYKYSGSMTTPPCTEGAKWFVLKTPIKLSQSQLDDFKEAMPENNRPLQELNSRTILD